MPKFFDKKKRDKKDKDKDKDRDKKERAWKKRFCRFCKDPEMKVDYKDGRALFAYLNERGKILPRRITSNCAYHQREVTLAIKRARTLALIPYSATQEKW